MEIIMLFPKSSNNVPKTPLTFIALADKIKKTTLFGSGIIKIFRFPVSILLVNFYLCLYLDNRNVQRCLNIRK